MIVNVTAKAGNLSINFGGGINISGIGAAVDYAGDKHNLLTKSADAWTLEGENGRYTARGGDFTLSIYERGGAVIISAAYLAREDIKSAVSFRPFYGRYSVNISKCMTNGFSECNGNRMNEMQATPAVTALIKNQYCNGSDSALIEDSDGGFALFGACSFCEYFSDVTVCENGGISFGQALDGRAVAKGQTVFSDSFCVFTGLDARVCLTGYAGLIRIFSDTPPMRKETPSGWCSWYYYGPNISEEKILENAAVIKEKGLPVKIIQIDDGWAVNRGDWVANERFSGGMERTARRIKDLGFVPGLWIAPFMADEDSALFKNHKDWFVKEFDGDGLFGYPSIDYSRPDAQQYLYDTFRRISRDWGYRYIKFDLVLGSLSAGRHYDPSFNGIKNYRKALEIMRAAVTPDTFLLACTSPIGASAGLADGVRVSKDIFERWQSLKEVAGQVLKRFYYGGSGLCVDPDCLMVRKLPQHDGDAFRVCTRNDTEIETYITMMSAAGGAVMLSDKMSLLDDADFDKIRALFPLNEEGAYPLDLFERDIPSVLAYGRRGDAFIYSVTNWEDIPQTFNVSHGAAAHVYEFWSKEYLGFRDRLDVTLPPHKSCIYYFADRPNYAPSASIMPSGKNAEEGG